MRRIFLFLYQRESSFISFPRISWRMIGCWFQVEKMKEIAKLKAKEEKRKLESEVMSLQ